MAHNFRIAPQPASQGPQHACFVLVVAPTWPVGSVDLRNVINQIIMFGTVPWYCGHERTAGLPTGRFHRAQRSRCAARARWSASSVWVSPSGWAMRRLTHLEHDCKCIGAEQITACRGWNKIRNSSCYSMGVGVRIHDYTFCWVLGDGLLWVSLCAAAVACLRCPHPCRRCARRAPESRIRFRSRSLVGVTCSARVNSNSTDSES